MAERLPRSDCIEATANEVDDDHAMFLVLGLIISRFMNNEMSMKVGETCFSLF